ncbi:MAG: sulfotransferase [Paracoccaceae bacterium]
MSPVTFVFGAMRSGTTVFRLMLNAHSKVNNPGEFDFLFDYIFVNKSHPTGWVFNKELLMNDRNFRRRNLVLDDKLDGLDLLDNLLVQISPTPGAPVMLNVHRNVDRIVKIFPDTRIIHLLRDPRDVALSSIGMGWAAMIYYGVDHWLTSEWAWEESAHMISSDQIYTLKYEDLFSNTEQQLTQVCQFIGIPFEAAMLRYHENTSYGPPNAKSIGAWKNKASAHEVALLEGKAATMMTRRGYVLNGPAAFPGRLEKFLLWARNKFGVWGFSGRRFGHGLYWGEKISRWSKLSGLNKKFQRRMHTISIQHLK